MGFLHLPIRLQNYEKVINSRAINIHLLTTHGWDTNRGVAIHWEVVPISEEAVISEEIVPISEEAVISEEIVPISEEAVISEEIVPVSEEAVISGEIVPNSKDAFICCRGVILGSPEGLQRSSNMKTDTIGEKIKGEAKNESKEADMRNFERAFIHDWKKALRRVEEGRKCCEHLSKIFGEIVRIEKEYELSLRKLCSIFREFNTESSGIRSGIMSLKKNIERRCEQIKDFVNYVECEILNNTLNSTVLNHKNVFDNIKIDGIDNDKVVEKTRNDSIVYIEKCVDAYESLIECINIFHNSTYYHPLKRIELSNMCIDRYLDAKKKEYEYKNTINNVNEVELRKEKRIKSILFSLESMDYKRIACIKDNVMKYLIFFTSYIRNVQYDINSCIDIFKEVDAYKEIEEYCILNNTNVKKEKEDNIFYSNIVSWPMLMDYVAELHSAGDSFLDVGPEAPKKSRYGGIISALFDVNMYKNLLPGGEVTSIHNHRSRDNGSSNRRPPSNHHLLINSRVYTDIFNEIVFLNKKEGKEFPTSGDSGEEMDTDEFTSDEGKIKKNGKICQPEQGQKCGEGTNATNILLTSGKLTNEENSNNEGNELSYENEGKNVVENSIIKRNYPDENDIISDEMIAEGGYNCSFSCNRDDGNETDCVKGRVEKEESTEEVEKEVKKNPLSTDYKGKDFEISKHASETVRSIKYDSYQNRENGMCDGESYTDESDYSYSYVKDMFANTNTHTDNDTDMVIRGRNCSNHFKKMKIFFLFYLKNLFFGNLHEISGLNIVRYFNIYNNRFLFCECLIHFIKKKRVHLSHMKNITMFAKIILSFLDYCNLYFDYWSSIYILVASENFYVETEQTNVVNVRMLIEKVAPLGKVNTQFTQSKSVDAAQPKTKSSDHEDEKKSSYGNFFFSDENENSKNITSQGKMSNYSKTKDVLNGRSRSVVNIYECRNEEGIKRVQEDANGKDIKEEAHRNYIKGGDKPIDSLELNESYEHSECEEKISSNEQKNVKNGFKGREVDIGVHEGEQQRSRENDTNCLEDVNRKSGGKLKKMFLHKFLYAHTLWNNIKFWEVCLLTIISEVIQEAVLLEKLRYENKEMLIKNYFFFFKYFSFYDSMIDYGLSINQIGLLLNKIFHSFNLKNDPISRKFFFQVIDIATNKKITLNYIKMDSSNLNNEYKKYYLQYYNNYLNDDSKGGGHGCGTVSDKRS
ncbi:conserved Plasmodium protein, unknown function [Plasmodium ovale curtisi]|uniref:Uncharacterized protein n=1 Tax=Plasmodium ovale curtisi TaxID=864141 RepID=A0A1A8WBI4_PLAOA|nr:conserved Plasmodium protein, unknown function [Plasmodium ovale curtisi]